MENALDNASGKRNERKADAKISLDARALPIFLAISSCSFVSGGEFFSLTMRFGSNSNQFATVMKNETSLLYYDYYIVRNQCYVLQHCKVSGAFIFPVSFPFISSALGSTLS